MNLEIHKSAKAPDLRIDFNEVFPSHYAGVQLEEVCEMEAKFLFDALRATLPHQTKQALVRMIERGGLVDE